MDSREPRSRGQGAPVAVSIARVLATMRAAFPLLRSLPKVSSSTMRRADDVRRSMREDALDSLRRSRGVKGSRAQAAVVSKRVMADTAAASRAMTSVGSSMAASAMFGTTAES